jgi:uncharacterized membrane protein
MNAMTCIFSFLCSQDASRSFTIAGHLMPLCQRCTGLYAGMGISFVWLLVSRNRQKGLPPRSAIYINVACLLTMPVFGFHFLDPGPSWRFWSGLIYGNALVYLLLPATSVICSEAKWVGPRMGASTISFWLLFAFLNGIPLWFPFQSDYCFWAAVLLTFIGLACVVFCIAAITVYSLKKTLASVFLKGFGDGFARS